MKKEEELTIQKALRNTEKKASITLFMLVAHKKPTTCADAFL